MFHLFQTGLPKVLTFAGVAQQMGWAMPADVLYMKKTTGPLRLNKQTWQVLTISFIIGLAPVAVYTAILMSRTAFSKMEWTQSRKGCFWCQSFDPMEDFKPPQQKLGRCLGETGVMDLHRLSSLTMHFFLFQVAGLQRWERQAGFESYSDLKGELRSSLVFISRFCCCTSWNSNRGLHVCTIGCADDTWWRQSCRDRVCSSLWLRISRCRAWHGFELPNDIPAVSDNLCRQSISWDKSQTESESLGG